ncbi:MAG TPA: hypothetical protein VGC95_11045, partial [Chitinophagaceae bacterium]
MSVAGILAILFAACNYNDAGKNDATTTTEKKEKSITSRDVTINASNSYSDLFMDTSALGNFIRDKKVPDSLADRMRSFYNSRNFEYAWFNTDGLTEEARAFWNLYDYVTSNRKDTSLRDKALSKQMNRLTATDTLRVGKSDKKILNAELGLTENFIRYMLQYYEKGAVKRKEMERFIPAKKQDPLRLADSLLNKKHKDDKYFEDLNPAYKALKTELARYDSIAKKGGWPAISLHKKLLKKNAS